MAVATASPGETITAALWNELAGLVNGTTGFGNPLIATQINSDSFWAITARNQGSLGQAVRVQNAAGNANLLTVADAALTVGNLPVVAESLNSSSLYAGSFKNAHSGGKAFRILDPDGWNAVNFQRSAGGRNVFSINMKNGSVPENNLFLVAENRVDTSVMADFELDNTAGGGTVDSTALRGVGRVSGGAGATRSLEAFTHRLAPATTNSTWGIGLTTFTDVVGLGPTYNCGIFLNGGAGLAGEVENDAALLIAGVKGWSHGYYQLDSPAQSTRMASIDKLGKIVCGNISPRTDGTFSLGSSASDAFLAAFCDTFVITGGGAEAAPPYTFIAQTTTGMFLKALGSLGFSTAGTERMSVSSAGMLMAVPVLAANGSATDPGLAFANSTGMGFYRVAGNNLGVATAGVLRSTWDQVGNYIHGQAALATNATNGFQFIPTCPGTPTGTPPAYTGVVPWVYDDSAHKIWFKSGGTWRGVAVA